MADIEGEAAGEINGFKDALLGREPYMMLTFSDREIQQRDEQVLEDAILRAARAGMPPDDLAGLRRLVLGPYKKAFRRGLIGEPPAQVELGSVRGRSTAAYACPDADYSLPSKCTIEDKKLELVELVGGQTPVHTTFDPDSVQVMVRDLMDAKERRRKKVMDLVRKNRAKMRDVDKKVVLLDLRWGTTYLWQESDSPASRRNL